MTLLGRTGKNSDKKVRSLGDTKRSSFCIVVTLVQTRRNNLWGEL